MNWGCFGCVDVDVVDRGLEPRASAPQAIVPARLERLAQAWRFYWKLSEFYARLGT